MVTSSILHPYTILSALCSLPYPCMQGVSRQRFYWEVVVNSYWDRSYHKSHCSLHLNKKDVREELYLRKDVPESFCLPHCSCAATCMALLVIAVMPKRPLQPSAKRRPRPEITCHTLLQNHVLGYSCVTCFQVNCIGVYRWQKFSAEINKLQIQNLLCSVHSCSPAVFNSYGDIPDRLGRIWILSFNKTAIIIHTCK